MESEYENSFWNSANIDWKENNTSFVYVYVIKKKHIPWSYPKRACTATGQTFLCYFSDFSFVQNSALSQNDDVGASGKNVVFLCYYEK